MSRLNLMQLSRFQQAIKYTIHKQLNIRSINNTSSMHMTRFLYIELFKKLHLDRA